MSSYLAENSNIDVALTPIDQALEAKNVDYKVTYKIHLALEELLSNIINYAYDEPGGMMDLDFSFEDNDETLVIVIKDQGKPFNPFDMKDPDLTGSASERKIGGLGIYLVKNTVDFTNYKREGDSNIITLKKKIFEA